MELRVPGPAQIAGLESPGRVSLGAVGDVGMCEPRTIDLLMEFIESHVCRISEIGNESRADVHKRSCCRCWLLAEM